MVCKKKLNSSILIEVDKKRVCYLIFSSTLRAGGGHFHSLKTIITGIGSVIDYHVFNAGLVLGKPLKDFPKTTYVPFGRWSVLGRTRLLYQLVREFKPDVIHAFDLKSLWLARLIGYLLGKPVVFNKCGGSNGSDFIPRADAYVLFSGENLQHFQQNRKIGGPIHLIPNRAKKKKQDIARIDSLRDALGLSGKSIILRISRVNPYYHRTYEQAIALLKSRLQIVPNTVLLFVGFVQDEAFFDQLKKEVEGLPVYFVTESNYTRDAAELISIADACVATGRGVMEAASTNIIVYCPVADAELPVPLNWNTLPQLLHYNFSERAKGVPYEREKEIVPVGKSTAIEEIFEQYFSISAAIPKYLNIYQNVKIGKASFVNFVGHGLRFLKGLG